MVHQVTGADDLPLPPPSSLSLPQPTELLRSVHAPAGAGALMLPTLDTSAFLLGRRAGPATRTEAAPAPLPCDGSVALVGGVEQDKIDEQRFLRFSVRVLI
ncbi:hypothetical protein E2562_015789 [Oryza meyeriana var. granulata]|uniref:Uncharacterized protein n=1 Tax=Oryza meyeriana var. granulata TaxID=110450 RepID=A0A6G1D3J5_9ORYZ|nr:hypothetical protein E2562_015789 [Oryza meyeriana var. granulata]